MTTPLALGIVSDEVTNDFGEALRHGTSWGIERYEIRCLTTGRVPRVEKQEIKTVAGLVREHGVRITALSPGMFKAHLSRTAEIEEEIHTVLPATLDLARELSCPMIIVFGFQREAGEPADRQKLAVEYMRRAADVAAAAGVRIAIENEPGFWCDTGVNTLQIITATGAPGLGANWDPCNAYGTDEVPYPHGYEALKPRIINVHAKDTAVGSLIRCVRIGEGALDWQGQVTALLKDRLVEHITIETHCHPLIESSRHNVDILRRMMAAAH
jgi:sugar phosphate isomerase/epimerase